MNSGTGFLCGLAYSREGQRGDTSFCVVCLAWERLRMGLNLESARQVVQFNVGITLESLFHVSLCNRNMMCSIRDLSIFRVGGKIYL